MTDRKSDYTGDRFGDWVVMSRAKAQEGKRCWSVTNTVTDEQRVVLQTELKDLPKEASVQSPVTIGTAESIGPLGDLVRASNNPFSVPAIDFDAESDSTETGTVETNPFSFPGRPDEVAEYIKNEMSPKQQANVLEADARAVAYVPQGENALSAQIAASVIGKNVVTRFDGIGEAAEDGVSEAELDGRVPPSCPVRAAIRRIMGELQDHREAIASLGARADELMAMVDEAMKAALTK